MKRMKCMLLLMCICIFCAVLGLTACGKKDNKTSAASNSQTSSNSSVLDSNSNAGSSVNSSSSSSSSQSTQNSSSKSVITEQLKPTDGLEYKLNEDGQSYSVVGIGTATATKIVISNTYQSLPVTSIGEYAFNVCSKLTSVTIPNGITTIGQSAFYGCGNLTSITIPSSVTTIGGSVFSWCTAIESFNVDNNNKNFSSQDGILYNKDKTQIICVPATKTNVTIPSTVTSIGNESFFYCDLLTSVTIPNGVTSIGGAAFMGCDSLTSVTMPNGLTSIGGNAFKGCELLTSIIIPETVTSIGYGAFDDCWLTINCEAASQPSGWTSGWCSSGCTVVWEYKG